MLLLQVQLGALCILSRSLLLVTSFSLPLHLSADFQLAFINHDDRRGYLDHNHHRWHQVRWHPFKWVAQVSLLTHLTTRHQWDEHFHSARLVTHTHTGQWDVACYQIVCQHQLVLLDKEEGGGLTPTARSQEAKSRLVVRSHQGPKWLGSGPPRGRDDQRGRGGMWSSVQVGAKSETTEGGGRLRGALGLGFGLLPISGLSLALFNCSYFITYKPQRIVCNCCTINIFRWYWCAHINGTDPSPITFLIHSGQEENNLSSLNALHWPFLSTFLSLYILQNAFSHLYRMYILRCTF